MTEKSPDKTHPVGTWIDTDTVEKFHYYMDRGELRYPCCPQTGTALGYTARQCPKHPGEDLDWAPASGGATLESFVIYHQRYSPDFEPPYNVAMVALDEGPLMVATVLVDDLAKLVIGMKLISHFEPAGRLVFVPT
ncbi:MAG: OB-fold domain-containing protein [Marinosulfonomonas sp.]|nr:OB-fold domain-containing protein [Marinosulfonomonas sp.]